jgi:protein phosphatase
MTKEIRIVGDLHGDLQAFRNAVAGLGSNDIVVFLGDYADRGLDGLEVIEELIALIARHPDRVVALKGNHEDYGADGEPKFHPCTLKEEVINKRGNWQEFFSGFRKFSDSLFYAAIIPGYALLLHGGISESIQSVEHLSTPSAEIINSILWSDPGEGTGSKPNPRGAGTVFGSDVTAKTLDGLELKYLIRGHQPARAWDGPCFDHEARVITTSGTAMYGGMPFMLTLDTDNLPDSIEGFRSSVQNIS